MINIKILKRKNLLLGFKIEGHALSDDEDYMKLGDAYDLICNSVSILSQSTVLGITEVLKIKANHEIYDGFLDINLSNLKESEIESCQVLLKTFEVSLVSLVESIKLSFGNKKSSEYIRFKNEEV